MAETIEADYVIVGAGSAGCVMAARLSEDPGTQVVLLEAGPKDSNPWIHIPLGYGKPIDDKRVNWCYETEPDLNGRRFFWPRGKVLGGSSSINGLVYIRGQAEDFDHWRQLGNAGWSFDDVLPYFRKSEDKIGGGDDLHGTGGLLAVSEVDRYDPISQAFVKSCVDLGFPRTNDFNGRVQEGAGYYQTTTARSRRWSTAKAYLEPAKARPNLVIRTGCQATRVLLENGRAVGVEYQSPAGRQTARANREVVVSGGAYGSPQLLQLSGLGPAEHLRDMGIEVIRDMPAVGSNLHDHFGIYLMWKCSKAITMNDLENSWPRKIMAGIRYGLFRDGPMAVNGIRAGIFTRTDARLERPDMQINLLEWSTLERSKDKVIPHPFPGFTLGPVHLSPDGRGTVRLGSPDPLAQPAITFGFLGSEYDMRAMVEGVKLARKIAEQPAMKPYVVNELVPGLKAASDADLEQFVRDTGVTNHHPTSSCAMGTGTNTVVDPRLRVHGIEGLRVADASIMPSVVAGNTNAPSIMIGEKAAAMILEDAA